jgi:hypothetical protein
MMFLGWYDDNAKTPVVDKIAVGAAAYRARFHTAATVCLCNEVDRQQIVEVDGLQVRADATVSRNNFWIGVDGDT